MAAKDAITRIAECVPMLSDGLTSLTKKSPKPPNFVDISDDGNLKFQGISDGYLSRMESLIDRESRLKDSAGTQTSQGDILQAKLRSGQMLTHNDLNISNASTKDSEAHEGYLAQISEQFVEDHFSFQKGLTQAKPQKHIYLGGPGRSKGTIVDSTDDNFHISQWFVPAGAGGSQIQMPDFPVDLPEDQKDVMSSLVFKANGALELLKCIKVAEKPKEHAPHLQNPVFNMVTDARRQKAQEGLQRDVNEVVKECLTLMSSLADTNAEKTKLEGLIAGLERERDAAKREAERSFSKVSFYLEQRKKELEARRKARMRSAEEELVEGRRFGYICAPFASKAQDEELLDLDKSVPIYTEADFIKLREVCELSSRRAEKIAEVKAQKSWELQYKDLEKHAEELEALTSALRHDLRSGRDIVADMEAQLFNTKKDLYLANETIKEREEEYSIEIESIRSEELTKRNSLIRKIETIKQSIGKIKFEHGIVRDDTEELLSKFFREVVRANFNKLFDFVSSKLMSKSNAFQNLSAQLLNQKEENLKLNETIQSLRSNETKLLKKIEENANLSSNSPKNADYKSNNVKIQSISENQASSSSNDALHRTNTINSSPSDSGGVSSGNMSKSNVNNNNNINNSSSTINNNSKSVKSAPNAPRQSNISSPSKTNTNNQHSNNSNTNSLGFNTKQQDSARLKNDSNHQKNQKNSSPSLDENMQNNKIINNQISDSSVTNEFYPTGDQSPSLGEARGTSSSFATKSATSKMVEELKTQLNELDSKFTGDENEFEKQEIKDKLENQLKQKQEELKVIQTTERKKQVESLLSKPPRMTVNPLGLNKNINNSPPVNQLQVTANNSTNNHNTVIHLNEAPNSLTLVHDQDDSNAPQDDSDELFSNVKSSEFNDTIDEAKMNNTEAKVIPKHITHSPKSFLSPYSSNNLNTLDLNSTGGKTSSRRQSTGRTATATDTESLSPSHNRFESILADALNATRFSPQIPRKTMYAKIFNPFTNEFENVPIPDEELPEMFEIGIQTPMAAELEQALKLIGLLGHTAASLLINGKGNNDENASGSLLSSLVGILDNLNDDRGGKGSESKAALNSFVKHLETLSKDQKTKNSRRIVLSPAANSAEEYKLLGIKLDDGSGSANNKDFDDFDTKTIGASSHYRKTNNGADNIVDGKYAIGYSVYSGFVSGANASGGYNKFNHSAVDTTSKHNLKRSIRGFTTRSEANQSLNERSPSHIDYNPDSLPGLVNVNGKIHLPTSNATGTFEGGGGRRSSVMIANEVRNSVINHLNQKKHSSSRFSSHDEHDSTVDLLGLIKRVDGPHDHEDGRQGLNLSRAPDWIHKAITLTANAEHETTSHSNDSAPLLHSLGNTNSNNNTLNNNTMDIINNVVNDYNIQFNNFNTDPTPQNKEINPPAFDPFGDTASMFNTFEGEALHEAISKLGPSPTRKQPRTASQTESRYSSRSRVLSARSKPILSPGAEAYSSPRSELQPNTIKQQFAYVSLGDPSFVAHKAEANMGYRRIQSRNGVRSSEDSNRLQLSNSVPVLPGPPNHQKFGLLGKIPIENPTSRTTDLSTGLGALKAVGRQPLMGVGNNQSMGSGNVTPHTQTNNSSSGIPPGKLDTLNFLGLSPTSPTSLHMGRPLNNQTTFHPKKAAQSPYKRKNYIQGNLGAGGGTNSTSPSLKNAGNSLFDLRNVSQLLGSHANALGVVKNSPLNKNPNNYGSNKKLPNKGSLNSPPRK